MGKVVESHLVVEDLPEAMLHSVRDRQNMASLLHNSTGGSTLHVRGSMDGSLLASLQLAPRDRYSTLIYDVWFKGALIACLLLIFLTMIARLIIWKKNSYKVRYRVIPQVDGRQPPPPRLGHRPHLSWVTSFFSVPVPLLREVSEV